MKNKEAVMNNKLSVKTRFGYGIGYVASALLGDFMSGYLFFLLTYSAGVAPALAGTISMVGTISMLSPIR